jgi:hypothetical protein
MARQASTGKSRTDRAAPPVRSGGEHVQSLARALALLNRISEAADGGATPCRED